MADFFIYIAKSTLALTLFFVFFRALLSKKTFFRFNRYVLLTGMIVCTVLPAIHYKTTWNSFLQVPFNRFEELLTEKEEVSLSNSPASESFDFAEVQPKNDYHGSMVVVPQLPDDKLPLIDDSNDDLGISVLQVIGILYCMGVLVCLTFLIVSIQKMIKIIRKGKKIIRDGNCIILTKEKICPFSWYHYIVLNERDYENSPTEIIVHEQAHLRRRHVLDLIFAELFVLFHWFNPVIWLLKRELRDIHEYEADMEVINQGIDATKYQLLLVKKAVGARSYTIANSFNHSKIKNRITMMLKRKSTQWARLKLLLFTPLAALTLQAFARPEMAETLSNNEITSFTKENELKEQDFSYIENDTVPIQSKNGPSKTKGAPSNAGNDAIPVQSKNSPSKVKDPKPPKPPKLQASNQYNVENTPMTEQEKAATKEFEAASEKFEAVMSKHSAEMEQQFNSEGQAFSKDMEEAGKKFEASMEKFQKEMDASGSKQMEIESKKLEVASEKFQKVMEANEKNLQKGTESAEVKAAKEEFKAAQESFRKNTEQFRSSMLQMKDSDVKAARDEFKATQEKHREQMSQMRAKMQQLKDDPEFKAAREEYNAAKEKYKNEMKAYRERAREQKAANS